MTNPYGMPGYSVQEVAAKLKNGEDFIIIDVREPRELLLAEIEETFIHIPLSLLSMERLTALPEAVTEDKGVEIVVMCHHGNRSAQVTAWLRQEGWTNVYNMDGGIEAYAVAIDNNIGRY